jgi:hypothetical protein
MIREWFGRLSGAETKTRRFMLAVGVGVFSYVVGTIAAGTVSDGIDALGVEIASPFVNTAIAWTLSRLWLFMFLPVASFLLSRVMSVAPLSFSVVSALSGEAFSLFFFTARMGLEPLIDSLTTPLIRILTFVAGLAVVLWAARVGARMQSSASERAQQQALARQAEYNEMLERAGRETSSDKARL